MSRLAVIADVHGNSAALAAVVDELRRDPPELVVVNGDLSWGPEPEETLALAGEIENAVFVRGNAESALLRLSATLDGEPSEVERWMLERHTGSVGLPYGASPAAYWAELGPDVRLKRTAYDVDEAVSRTERSGIPTAERLVGLLREPPTSEEMIAEAERLEVSD